ncbi:kinase-like protein [Trametes polyzona]|nr:kinase-like protein [Trametes polyzona]
MAAAIVSRLVGALSALLWPLWRCLPDPFRFKAYSWLARRYRTAGMGFGVQALPFGLVSKGCMAPRYEADCMRFVAKHTSIPVPHVLDVIEFDRSLFAKYGSCGLILMTRLDGEPLTRWISRHVIRAPGQKELLDQLDACLARGDSEGLVPIMAELEKTPHPTLDVSDAGPLLQDLRDAFKQLRSIPPPASPSICSASGGPLRCIRTGSQEFIGPFNEPQEFKDAIFALANSLHFAHRMPVLRRLAEPVNAKQHRVWFTHADLAARNVLVKDGRLSGIVDWEFAGWYPEYWELVSMEWQMVREPLAHAFWDAVGLFGPEPYQEELALEWALLCCSGDTALFDDSGDEIMVSCPRVKREVYSSVGLDSCT